MQGRFRSCVRRGPALREILDNDKNGQGRKNGEGEQWTSIEG